MKRAISVNKKKRRGRPATGHDPLVAVRLPKGVIEAIDRWGERQEVKSRSDAIRGLIEKALKG